VVINNFNIVSIAVNPFEADTPLVIDPDAVLAFTASAQSFKPVAWRHKQVLKRFGSMEIIKLTPCRSFKGFETPYKPIIKECFSVLILE
jgi:hypothetical protein